MSPPTVGAIDAQMPDALPIKLQPCNWHELETEDARKIWEHYKQFLLGQGYHIMGSTMYDTLGSEVTEIPLSAADPFHPNDIETFIHRNNKPKSLLFTRAHSSWQPCVEICFGIDSFQWQVVFKAVTHESTELKALHMLTSPSLQVDQQNHVIPILNFLETRDIVIVIMAGWGLCWEYPCLVWLHEQGVAHGDIHPRNIVINHSDSRDLAALAEDDFQQTSDLEYAFIDFGSAHIFSPGAPPITSPLTIPPDPIPSPEQEDSEENEGTIDVFAADVYNLGKSLETELTAALHICSFDSLCHSLS
ncbi:hypothetical protein M422DRAFT_242403 [Sphaerobolus stellatus SS14]|nr:hypothetical protein M422DRAFT_242403 [Sphaerobolus stellatus SS14]